jgi:hypothetical protein
MTVHVDRQRDRRCEVRIVRAVAPACYRLAGLRRWRWTVTHYWAVDGQNRGVADARVHLGADGGYTFTWLGAAIAAVRLVTDEFADCAR